MVYQAAGLDCPDANNYLFSSDEPPLPKMRNTEKQQNVVTRTWTSNGPPTGHLVVLASDGELGRVASNGRLTGRGKSTTPGLPPGRETS